MDKQQFLGLAISLKPVFLNCGAYIEMGAWFTSCVNHFTVRWELAGGQIDHLPPVRIQPEGEKTPGNSTVHQKTG